MRVLVTGSAGFIGGAICRALDAAGHETVTLDVMLPQAHGSAEVPPGTLRRDVRETEGWAEVLHGVDAVCHQAALVGAGVRVGDLPLYADINDVGTTRLLVAMHDAGVRNLVLASSMVVYGEGRYTCAAHGPVVPGVREPAALDAGRFDHACPRCGDPLDWALVEESAPIEPRSGYAASKAAQEHYAAAWVRQAGGSVIALRYHNVYGPLMPRDTPYSGVAAMFRSSLERGDAPRVFEDGQQMRDFVHVDDVARANVLALEAVGQREGYAAYNVCSGQPIAIRAVADAVASGAATPIPPEVTGEYRAGDVRHVVASPERAAAELGFRAATGPEAGLREFATAPLRA